MQLDAFLGATSAQRFPQNCSKLISNTHEAVGLTTNEL